jgi:hypothetical protein
MNYIIEKLRDYFDQTIESGQKYEGQLKNIDYYGLFCQAASKNQLHKLMGNNMCMFNYEFEGKESVMILFSIPLNSTEETGSKGMAERTMEVVENMEKCFINIEKTISKEVKEDKFMYLLFIKTIGD